jgi:hypothetical protein
MSEGWPGSCVKVVKAFRLCNSRGQISPEKVGIEEAIRGSGYEFSGIRTTQKL